MNEDSPTCVRPRCGRLAFRRGLCVSCYREARRTGTLAVRRNLRRADVVEDVEWLLQTGETHPETVARRVGFKNTAALHKALRRAERVDLIARLGEPDAAIA